MSEPRSYFKRSRATTRRGRARVRLAIGHISRRRGNSQEAGRRGGFLFLLKYKNHPLISPSPRLPVRFSENATNCETSSLRRRRRERYEYEDVTRTSTSTSTRTRADGSRALSSWAVERQAITAQAMWTKERAPSSR